MRLPFRFLIFRLILPVAAAGILFPGCFSRVIKERMDAQKELLSEIERQAPDPGIIPGSQGNASETSQKKDNSQVTGEKFSDIFDMLDYEEVSFTLIKNEGENNRISVTNNLPGKPAIPLKNSYELPGALIPEGTENFRLIYDPEKNYVIEFEIR